MGNANILCEGGAENSERIAPRARGELWREVALDERLQADRDLERHASIVGQS